MLQQCFLLLIVWGKCPGIMEFFFCRLHDRSEMSKIKMPFKKIPTIFGNILAKMWNECPLNWEGPTTLGIEVLEISSFNLQAHLWYYRKWENRMLLKYKLFHWLSGYITLDIGISVLSGHLSSLIGNFFKVQNKIIGRINSMSAIVFTRSLLT